MNQSFYIRQHGTTHEVIVLEGKYASNNRPSLELLDAEDGLPYATVSVNMDNVLLMEREILIKDYSENEGIFEFLVENNIITPTKNGVHTGYVFLPVGIINDRSVWGKKEVPETQALSTDSTGKQLFVIKGYNIWAETYAEACLMIPLIENEEWETQHM